MKNEPEEIWLIVGEDEVEGDNDFDDLCQHEVGWNGARVFDSDLGPYVKQQWRPISTAPKDGTEVLGLTQNEGCHVMKFEAVAWGCTFYDGYLPQDPTHWQPLPSGLKEEEG